MSNTFRKRRLQLLMKMASACSALLQLARLGSSLSSKLSRNALNNLKMSLLAAVLFCAFFIKQSDVGRSEQPTRDKGHGPDSNPQQVRTEGFKAEPDAPPTPALSRHRWAGNSSVQASRGVKVSRLKVSLCPGDISCTYTRFWARKLHVNHE